MHSFILIELDSFTFRKKLEENVDLGKDIYPVILEECFRLLLNEQNRLNEDRLCKFGQNNNSGALGSSFYKKVEIGIKMLKNQHLLQFLTVQP